MGSARYSAAGAEAALGKILDGDEPEVSADGAEGDAPADEGRVDPPQREVPRQEPERQPEPELPEPEAEPEVEERVARKPAKAVEPEADEEVELVRRGQRIRVPKSRAIELAQKGFDYESRMRELKDHEDELRKDAKGWQAYLEYRKYMRENQPAAQAVANLLQYFEEKGRVPKMDLEGEGEPGTERAPEWMQRFQERIDSRFEMLEKRELERDRDRLARNLMDAVRSQPVLKRLSEACLAAKKPDRALQKLATAMHADPNADPFEVAAEVATDLSQDVETLNPAARTYVDEKHRDQRRFGRPERPGAVAPSGPTAETKEYSAKDLKDGTVRRGVKAFLDSAFGES